MNTIVLKQNITIGKLTWIRTPSGWNHRSYAIEMLMRAGFEVDEITHLSAKQFLLLSRLELLGVFPAKTKVVVVTDLELIEDDHKTELLQKVAQCKKLKLRFGFGLVLASSRRRNPRVWPDQHPSMDLPDFGFLPLSIDDQIHEWIEIASLKYEKKILNLSAEVADFFEEILLKQGTKAACKAIDKAVQCAEGVSLVKIPRGFECSSISLVEV